MAITNTIPIRLWPFERVIDKREPHGLFVASGAGTGDVSGSPHVIDLTLPTVAAKASRIWQMRVFTLSCSSDAKEFRLETRGSYWGAGTETIAGGVCVTGPADSTFIYVGAPYVMITVQHPDDGRLFGIDLDNIDAEVNEILMQGYYWDRSELRAAGVSPRLW